MQLVDMAGYRLKKKTFHMMFSILYGEIPTVGIIILHNRHHVLQALLPPPADRNYNLRDRLHNRQLPGHMSHLTDCNFIV